MLLCDIRNSVLSDKLQPTSTGFYCIIFSCDCSSLTLFVVLGVDVKKTVVVTVSSDKGLCGGINSTSVKISRALHKLNSGIFQTFWFPQVHVPLVHGY